jgi:hypothetical protein
MENTITLTVGGTAVTTAVHSTNAPGLIVHGGAGRWRLTHEQYLHALGEFTDYDAAQDAATGLVGVAEWEGSPISLQDEYVVREVIEAIEEAGGRFLYRPGGLGECVFRARQAEQGGLCVLHGAST